MAEVTFQVLEGMERGQIFANIPTPFTVGREEDNAVQLNDERVSRFHLKIQEDAGQVILTDLESTNGTRVNGSPAQMRVLQIGDLVSIGRCLLVVGSPAEIAERFRAPSDPLQQIQDVVSSVLDGPDSDSERDIATGGTFEAGSPHPSAWNDMLDAAANALAANPPPLPDTFRLAQRAQLTDLVAYIHGRVCAVLSNGHEPTPNDHTGARLLDGNAWQQLVELEMRLAKMIRAINNPDSR